MSKYVIQRILLGFPVMFAIIIVTFGLSHALPGGPFDSNNQRRLPPHIRAQLEQQYGLSKPVFFNLPNDGKGSDVAWGQEITVKGHSDNGYETLTFDAPQGAGIQLYGEYRLVENGDPTCINQSVQPGWALLAHREVCVVTGGDIAQTFTTVDSYWTVDLLDAQFWNYLQNVIRLDFGPSLNLSLVQQNKQVADEIRERVPVSLMLGVFGTILGFSLGIPLGVMAAVYHNSPVDYGATFFAVVGQSIPAIVLAPVLILIFAVRLDLVPVADPLIWKEGTGVIWAFFRTFMLTVFFLLIVNRLLPGLQETALRQGKWRLLRWVIVACVGLGGAWLAWQLLGAWNLRRQEASALQEVVGPYARALILPVIVIGTGMSAGIARLTRASLLQVLNEDYIQTARAKGLRESRVRYVHALKNALIPVVTAVGPLLAGIVTGSFIVELIFSIPGMGDMFITAVGARDYTTIMGVTIFYSVVLILGNILVDIMYTWLDPRIRFN